MRCDDIVLGLDIGGTNLRMGIVTKDGRLKNFVRKNSNILAVDGNPMVHLISEIKAFLDSSREENPKAIAMGFPSPISKDKKVVYSPHNIGKFKNLNVVDVLEAEFRVPVFLDRDANFLLSWDMKNLNIPADAFVLGFYIGTGYGNSIYINGRFLTGKNGAAGELGHIPVFNAREICTCGNTGCIETYAAGKRLMQIKICEFPQTDISSIFTHHGSSRKIQEYLDWLSIPIATEMNILDPDYIVVGGGVVQMDDFPYKKFEEYLRGHLVKPFPSNNLSILYSSHNHESGVLGAAYQAFRNLEAVNS